MGSIQVVKKVALNFKGIGEGASQILRTVAPFIGVDLDARHLIAMETAKAKVKQIRSKSREEGALRARARRTAEARAIRYQRNIEAITTKALSSAPAQASAGHVDHDWTERFMRHAQEVSNEDVQAWWARILAGEVGRPGSFSLMTLDVLSRMHHVDADLLRRASRFSVQSDQETFLLIRGKAWDWAHKFGITYSDVIRLGELGLLSERDSGWGTEPGTSPDESAVVRCGTLGFAISGVGQIPGIAIFSTAGIELSGLCPVESDHQFLLAVQETFRASGFKVIAKANGDPIPECP